MYYTFKSKAAGDLLMMEPVGSELLRAIGQEPKPRGTPTRMALLESSADLG